MIKDDDFLTPRIKSANDDEKVIIASKIKNLIRSEEWQILKEVIELVKLKTVDFMRIDKNNAGDYVEKLNVLYWISELPNDLVEAIGLSIGKDQASGQRSEEEFGFINKDDNKAKRQ